MGLDSWKGIGAIFGILLVLGLMIVLFSNAPQNTVRVIDSPATGSGDLDVENMENIVTITSDGFSPETLTIQEGETVTFVNTDDSSHWPASDIHPTHTEYPDSHINKCGTNEESEIFDACRGLAEEETYSFTFNEAGTWEYHDHLKPAWTGTIIVE